MSKHTNKCINKTIIKRKNQTCKPNHQQQHNNITQQKQQRKQIHEQHRTHKQALEQLHKQPHKHNAKLNT